MNINNPPVPIFIAGCGRSGTTYLKTIVDAHPSVFIPTECLFMASYILKGHLVPKSLLKYLFFREPPLKIWYNGPEFDFSNVTELIKGTHEYAATENGAEIWGQKTPRFIRYIKDFENTIGPIKWILIYRDPRACIASMLSSKRHTYSLVLATKRWLIDNKIILKLLESGKIPDNIFIIKYEDLLNDFDTVIKEIFNFLNLPPLTQKDIERNAKVLGLSGTGFSQIAVREGVTPQKKFIDSWKFNLTAHQIDYIEKICGSEMIKLGYTCSSELCDKWHPVFNRYLLDIIKDIRIIIQYIRHWPSRLISILIREFLFFIFRISKLLKNAFCKQAN